MSHEQEKGRAPGFNRRRSSYKPLVVKEGVLTEGEVSRARTHHRKSVAGGTGISLDRSCSFDEAQTKLCSSPNKAARRKSKLWQLQYEEDEEGDEEEEGGALNGAASQSDKQRLLEIGDNEIQELFALMDVNKDHVLAPKELDCILRALELWVMCNKDQVLAPQELECILLAALGINATEADLIEFIRELGCGPNKDCVTYAQFAECIKANTLNTNETESLQDTFNAFDHAGDGFIDSEKMAQVLANLGLQFQQNDIVEVIQEIGTDGRIMFDDFQRFMLNTDTEE